jgi:hypothetical protein
MSEKLVFVLDEQMNGEAFAIAEAAAHVAADAFTAARWSVIPVAMRASNGVERNHLSSKMCGEIDGRQYLVDQANYKYDTGLYGPLKQVTVVDRPFYVYRDPRNPSRDGLREPFGFSIENYGEAIVAMPAIRRRARQITEGSLTKRLVRQLAFTMAHEAGHLYGLVGYEQDRSDGRLLEAGTNHCSNVCVMHAAPTVTEGEAIINQLGGPHFCDDCAVDLQNHPSMSE